MWLFSCFSSVLFVFVLPFFFSGFSVVFFPFFFSSSFFFSFVFVCFFVFQCFSSFSCFFLFSFVPSCSYWFLLFPLVRSCFPLFFSCVVGLSSPVSGRCRLKMFNWCCCHKGEIIMSPIILQQRLGSSFTLTDDSRTGMFLNLPRDYVSTLSSSVLSSIEASDLPQSFRPSPLFPRALS